MLERIKKLLYRYRHECRCEEIEANLRKAENTRYAFHAYTMAEIQELKDVMLKAFDRSEQKTYRDVKYLLTTTPSQQQDCSCCNHDTDDEYDGPLVKGLIE